MAVYSKKLKMQINSLRISFLFVALLLSLGACNDKEIITDINEPGSSSDPNILLIIADDMGKDATDGFSEGSIKPITPNINTLKDSGISFENCWVYPTCSPTRASIITGKYGYRTGVKWAGDILSSSETILHDYITQETNNKYATALIGKWHLSGNGLVNNPEDFGMDYYAGLERGAVTDYYAWLFTDDEIQVTETEYITKKFTDLSIDWINEQEKPWFLWLAYNAPHTPFHLPPAEMHSQGALPEYEEGMDEMPYYMAAIEAMDYQIGRLLDNMSIEERENTIILFVGDNGTPNQVAQSPYSQTTVKGSLYQGGINTPLYASGKNVTRIGEIDDNLITSTDLYATIAQLAGVSVAEINDSKSLVPLLTSHVKHRDFQYSERNSMAEDDWAISNGEYKLIVNANGNEEMYQLSLDPYESNNLLSGTLSATELEAKNLLESELTQIRN